jgi:2-oxoglutarate dehydrogenase E2 component (dihydrolipoamide succinyltransferase)
MLIAVQLPALGESVLEGTVARWLVKEGDRVEMDQALVEVTTDKVDAEIPSPTTGVVKQLLVMEGETIEIGRELLSIEPQVAGETSTKASAGAETGSALASPVGESPRVTASDPGPLATPVARRLADEARVDLSGVLGTGSGGRITKSDVQHHNQPGQSNPTSQAALSPTRGEPAVSSPQLSTRPAPARRQPPAYMQYTLQPGDNVVQMTPQRRLIAEHMVYSKHTSPHVGTVAELDITDVVRLRARHKGAFEAAHGFGLTFLPFIVQATVRALREFPALNASVLEDAIVEKRDINIGMAVETEKGLVAPVLRGADRLSLAGIAVAIDDISGRARSKRLSADELKGGTFTISNPGRRGNLYGFAIINQPQVGILRIGEIVKRPVVRTVDGEDTIAIRSMMHLALSYDHRAVDGQPANGFLFRIRELLEAADFDL